jgi:hypothetical protein
MIGRHHEQRIVLATLPRPKRSGGDRRRGIARRRLEKNAAWHNSDPFQLVHHEEPLLFPCRDQWRLKHGPTAAFDCRLKQRLIAKQRQELLGISRSRKRPQTRAAAA